TTSNIATAGSERIVAILPRLSPRLSLPLCALSRPPSPVPGPWSRVPGPRSSPRKLRLPLLQERRRPLHLVLRAVANRLGQRFDQQPRVEIDASGRVERDLGEPRGERSLAEDLFRQLAGAELKLSGRRDRGDQSHLERLLRVDDLAGENQVLRAPHADDARQALGGAGAGNDAEAELGLAEFRRVG